MSWFYQPLLEASVGQPARSGVVTITLQAATAASAGTVLVKGAATNALQNATLAAVGGTFTTAPPSPSRLRTEVAVDVQLYVFLETDQ